MKKDELVLDRETIDLGKVSLEEITNENLIPVMRLKVTEDQNKFVAPNSVSIAQGNYADYAWFKAICYDKTPVGFIMIEDDTDKKEYFLWRLMMDQRYQGFGICKKAMLMAIDYVKSLPEAKEFLTSYVPGEGSPYEFYKSLGFEDTDEMDGNEKILKLEL